MRYKFFSHYFFVTMLAVSFAAGLVWLEYFRDYRATLSILVIEKEPGMEASENLSELSKNLRFYEAVLAKNDLLDDSLAGQSADKRKADWQRMVKVENVTSSGLLTLEAWGDIQEQARLLAVTTATTLFDTASQYYNVKTEIDMRIVDGPLVGPAIHSYPKFIGASITTGFLISVTFFTFLTLLDSWFRRKKNLRNGSQPSQVLGGEEMFKPSLPPHWQDTEWTDGGVHLDLSQENERGISSLPRNHDTAPAPANLPVLDLEDMATSPLQGAMARLMKTDIDATVRANATEPEEIRGIEQEVIRTEEPTQEEYKRRLNALLSGRME